MSRDAAAELAELPLEALYELVYERQLSLSLLLNGTRRWYIAEYLGAPPQNDSYFQDYLEMVLLKLAELLEMMFEHGIYRLFIPVYSWHQPSRHPKAHFFLLKGIDALINHPLLTAVYEKHNVQVRFYGAAEIVSDEVRKELHQPKTFVDAPPRHYLYYGLEGDNPHTYALNLAYQFGMEHQRPPAWEDMLELYYGDQTLQPLDILIGFNRIYSRVGLPHLLEGNERIYNLVVTPLVLSSTSLRVILNDYLCNSHDWGRDYKDIHPNEVKRLKQFYSANQDTVIGLVKKFEHLAYPLANVNWPENMDDPT